jgi:predicted RNase H-like nuclease (RuvC/YqgF family)
MALHLIPWFGWMAMTALGLFTVHRVTKTTGDTLAKRIQQQTGIPQNKLHDVATEYRREPEKTKKKYTQKERKAIEKQNTEIQKLEDKVLKLNKELADENNPVEKAKIQKQLDDLKGQINEKKSNVAKIEQEVKVKEETFADMMENLGDPLTMTQVEYNNKAGGIDWSSKKNWLIMGGGFILVVIIVGFVKKLLDNLLKSTK